MDFFNLDKILSGQPKYRRGQVWRWIFVGLIDDWDLASDLSKELKELLNEKLPLKIDYQLVADRRSSKAVIRLFDGEVIESVLIENKDGRHTVCVSSQVGCPLGCAFCATGKGGFKRNLSAAEIIIQVLIFARLLKPDGGRVDNIVFMGMGEPFLNWDNVKKSIEIFNDPQGLNIGARSISISTCGLLEGIEALIKFPLQVNLAISLHSASDDLRSRLMPIANTVSLRELMKAVKKYLLVKKRKVMFEYVMMEGINDDPAQAVELIELIKNLGAGPVMVNLLTYNPTGKFKPSSPESIKRFKKILVEGGIEAIIRESVGGKILGACGQLAGKKSN
jgi:23S rRNA (adenine2503-C2)-methyltransferase